jgi:hypothetical protein
LPQTISLVAARRAAACAGMHVVCMMPTSPQVFLKKVLSYFFLAASSTTECCMIHIVNLDLHLLFFKESDGRRHVEVTRKVTHLI